MSTNYYQALSHLILAGTGVYSLKVVLGGSFSFHHGCFGIIIVNNILQLWRTGNPTYGDKIYDLCKLTRELQDIFILPLITTTLWLNYGYRWEYAVAHALTPIFPLVSYILDKKSYELENLVLFANLTSLSIISFLHDNYWGMAAAATQLLDIYLKQNESNYDIPYTELRNYILCFFTYFSLRAVLD